MKLLNRMICISLILLLTLCGCGAKPDTPQVVATTMPMYEFTTHLCQGTNIRVGQLITENVSCLHDYTLQVSQMRRAERAELVVLSGAGLDDFVLELLPDGVTVTDASKSVALHCSEQDHDHHEGHSHEQDPHIWLSPANCKIMAQNICDSLCAQYPEHTEQFRQNLQALLLSLDALQAYGTETLSSLSCREMITFHDGFAYFAESFDLTILRAVEEESGSEASAADLIALIQLVNAHELPAIFIERNGSSSAAGIIRAEAGVSVYTLDMAMSGSSYFDAMYQNINTLKEALG